MKIQYDPEFIERLKKQNVRIRKSFRKAIKIFSKNPSDARLHNHRLEKEYEGYRSIDITADWRAIYEEVRQGKDDFLIYFITLGTHKQLYR